MKKQELTASNADKYDLYLKSVQAPSSDARFLDRWFRKITGHHAKRFREDFCGTANLSCEFIRLRPDNRAFAVDIDPDPLLWCILYNVPWLNKSQRSRLELMKADVFESRFPKVDMIAAFNFSYWIFKERNVLLSYFKKVRSDLVSGGLFFIDVMGGPLNQEIKSHTFDAGDFNYVWELAKFNPIDNNVLFKIHFQFKNGSKIRNAFHYDCRMWSLPELKDLMKEAGFGRVTVLWQQANGNERSATDHFRISTQADSEGAWVAYLIAQT